MPLAICITKCWDSQATKLYYPGNVADLPEDHVFLKGKIKCFEPISLDEISKSHQDIDAKIKQMGAMIADLKEKVEGTTEGETRVDIEARKGPG